MEKEFKETIGTESVECTFRPLKMENEIKEIIRTVWMSKLSLISDDGTHEIKELHCFQDLDIVVSQLIIPTLSLFINAGALYYTQKSYNNNEAKVFEERLETLKSIQEILENYMVDPNIINTIIIEIGKKILKS